MGVASPLQGHLRGEGATGTAAMKPVESPAKDTSQETSQPSQMGDRDPDGPSC